MRHQPANLLGGSYRDENLLWSSQDTVNWLPTVAQQEGTRTQVKFATPPGLSYFTQCGDGPIRGARDVEGKLFVVSGNGLYEIALDGTPTNRGVIPGVGRVSMSHNKRGYGNQLLIANGDAGYVWDTTGTTLTKITDSGYPGAVMVDYLDHYLIQVEPFGRFWFHSNLDNASDYNTLDRYDAEAATDKMVGIAANQLEAVVFSGKTIEFFADTGATTGTFQSKRIVIERGCAGRHTIVKLDNTLMWLGNDGIFYRLNGYGAQPISPGPINRAIAGLDWSRAFGFTWEDKGYKVAYWTFPDGQTWGYDPTQPPGYQWHRRESYGLDRWRLNTCTLWQGQWIGGDYRTGVLFRLQWSAHHEMGAPLVSERTGPTVSDNQNAVICPYLELLFDTGVGAEGVPADELPPPLVLSGNVSSGYVGDSVDTEYTASGGVMPYVSFAVASGTFPPGLVLNPTSGAVTGTFSAAGAYAWSVRVVDAEGASVTWDDSATVVDLAVALPIPTLTTLLMAINGGGATDIASENTDPLLSNITDASEPWARILTVAYDSDNVDLPPETRTIVYDDPSFGGSVFWDSGWQGNAAHQSALAAALPVAGLSAYAGTISPRTLTTWNTYDSFLYACTPFVLPSDFGTYSCRAVIYRFGARVDNTQYLEYPDPAQIPVGAVKITGHPGYYLAGGVAYVCDWMATP